MSRASTEEESFDSLYRSTRRAVLLSTLALSGDLPAARAAVQDTYADAWRHRRTVTTLEAPLAWLRPRAWRRAQRRARRRHALRPRHRLSGVPPEQREVLAGLRRLTVPQRRAVLLRELSGLSTAEAAAEVDVPTATLDRHHREGCDALAAGLEVHAPDLPGRLQSLDRLLDDVVLPRGSRLRRADRNRRRRHAVTTAVAATVLTVGAGALASHPEDTGAEELGVAPSAPSPSVDPTATMPTADDLLYAEQLSRFGPTRTWHTVETGNNTSGDGLNTLCQQQRFADPRGYSALVRSFRADGAPERRAVQTVEISRSPRAAARAFRTTVGWYAGCQLARLQVRDAYHVDHVGDEADVLTLRVGRSPVRTVSVAVARAGSVTTSTVGTSAGGSPPSVREVTRSLGEAVEKLCARTGSPGCVGRPALRAVPPPPTGDERGLLAVADLPPVGRIDHPWVGTRATTPAQNPAATSCDRARFARSGAAARRSRTFLVPQASVPARFGLAETYGRFRSRRMAAAFLRTVRARVAGCERRELATKVTAGRTLHPPRADASTWVLNTEVARNERVRFRLGFVRVGRQVAQVTFAPTTGADMSDADFDRLVVRAGERLRELP